MKNILYILALVVISCNSASEEKPKAESSTIESQLDLSPEQIKNAGLSYDTLTPGELSSELHLNGKIISPPSASAFVSFPFSGTIQQLKTSIGTPVNAGQAIAYIESPELIDIQQNYLNARSTIKFLENDLARQKELNLNKANSDKTLQQAQLDMENKQIEMKALEAKLMLAGINPNSLNAANIRSMVEVPSTIQGKVLNIFVQNGQYIQASDRIAEIVNDQDVMAEITLTTNDVALIATGQQVEFEIVGSADKGLGHVSFIAPSANADNVLMAICNFDKAPAHSSPGMHVVAHISGTVQNGFIVPAESIVNWQNEQYIFIEETSGKYIFQKINILVSEESQVLLKYDEALLNKKIVSKNAYTLLMALKNKNEE